MLDNKIECTGCGACFNACKMNAINMVYNSDGFLFPIIDTDKCVHCGLCEKVCPIEIELQGSIYCRTYAAYLKETKELSEVSSGGVFWALAEAVIGEHGVVYGVSQESVFEIHHVRAESLEECMPMRRSKYLQSYTGKAYMEAKRDLEEGRLVLFSGTPCQIAGLRSYLQKPYDNLVACEVVCHGVPSMKVFKVFIEELQEKKQSKVKDIVFRDKRDGWKQNSISIVFDNGDEIVERSVDQLMHRSYLNGFCYRESCGHCKYAKLPRIADITLADYWNYSGSLSDMNNNKGISLVICSTKKGDNFFSKSKSFLNWENTSMDMAVQSCRHLTHSPEHSRYRSKFLKDLKKGHFKKIYKRYNKKTIRNSNIKKLAHLHR